MTPDYIKHGTIRKLDEDWWVYINTWERYILCNKYDIQDIERNLASYEDKQVWINTNYFPEGSDKRYRYCFIIESPDKSTDSEQEALNKDMTTLTQKIIIEYYQALGAPDDGLGNIYYKVDFETNTYERALECLVNIMKTCQGVITKTTINLKGHEQTNKEGNY